MTMELTPIQKEILISLINLFRQHNRAIKGEEIAEIIDRNPGTVRNQMQSLKALRLVDGVPGPKGGYKATSAAYEALDIEPMDEEALVRIFRNDRMVENANVAEIDLTTVRHPDLCRASVKVIGNIREFAVGDKIQIGPTPVNKLVIRGEVSGRDDTDNVILLNITEMVSLPKRPIKDYLKPSLITVPTKGTIQEASRTLTKHNIHGCLVEDNNEIVGVITFTDIGKALAEGRTNLKIKDIMSRNLISIGEDKTLRDAVKMLNTNGIGRLVVFSNGKPVGLITKTDVLNELAIY